MTDAEARKKAEALFQVIDGLDWNEAINRTAIAFRFVVAERLRSLSAELCPFCLDASVPRCQDGDRWFHRDPGSGGEFECRAEAVWNLLKREGLV